MNSLSCSGRARSLQLAAQLALAVLTCTSAGTWVHAATSLPGSANELAALPDGAWLAVDKRQLTWFGPDGMPRQQRAMRAEQLDLRTKGSQAVAVLLDSNTERVLPVRIDLASGQWQVQDALPAATGSVAALCLYRDAQGHDQVFVIGTDGIARQWVLHGGGAQLVRLLAVSPDAQSCRVDDRRAQLFVSGPDGVWAHRADPEGKPEREPVLLRRPLGPLHEGGGPLALLPEGLAVADPGRPALFVLERSGSGWRKPTRRPLPAGTEPDALAVWQQAKALHLAVRDDRSGRWSSSAWRGTAERDKTSTPPPVQDLPVVLPRVQTEPVAQYGDAADDPAIWQHPGDASLSRVLATDKKRGLAVYDLQGRERQFLPVGRVNNVDLRQGVLLGGERMDIAAATQRDDNSVLLWRIGADGEMSELGRVATGLDDIYGICAHRNGAQALEVFVNDKSGVFQQWRIERRGSEVAGVKLREFKLATQPEGCVADDARGQLFLGEERRGVWVVPTEAPAGAAAPLRMVLPVGPLLHADVEGMALYHGERASWLVVSSQGNNSYVVLDATPPYRPRGAFRIGMNLDAKIDGSSETDGLAVSSAAFGAGFPKGLLVVQDGFKQLPSGPQNFKYVSWEDVARALDLASSGPEQGR